MLLSIYFPRGHWKRVLVTLERALCKTENLESFPCDEALWSSLRLFIVFYHTVMENAEEVFAVVSITPA